MTTPSSSVERSAKRSGMVLSRIILDRHNSALAGCPDPRLTPSRSIAEVAYFRLSSRMSDAALLALTSAYAGVKNLDEFIRC